MTNYETTPTSTRLRAAAVPAPRSPVSLPPVSGLFRSFLISCILAVAAAGTGFGQQTATNSVDLKNAKSLETEIRFNAGTLKLTAHDGSKVESRFTYSRDAWKPAVKFTQQAG